MGASASPELVSHLHAAPDDLRPARVNNAIYRPVVADDPAIVRLAESIAQHGLLTPITVTRDNVILSGHRRHCACKLAGLTVVPIIRSPLHSCDPEFVQQLVAANESRQKTLAEQLKETIVAEASPEEAHDELERHRAARARADVPEAMAIKLGERRVRSQIDDKRLPFLNAVIGVLNDLQEFWPLSVRTIHYHLLNDPPLTYQGSVSKRAKRGDEYYRNDRASYQKLTGLLTTARIEGLVPFEATNDPTRPVTQWNAWQTPGDFMRAEVDGFLMNYWRDLMQSQPRHIEVVGEKMTLGPILRPVCFRYTVPLTIGRGYCSLPPRKAIYDRFVQSGKEGLTLVVLSDHDPDGEQIAESFARSMRDDFNVPARRITAVRAALTHTQVKELGLPPNDERAKKGSSGYARFVRQFGDAVHELEAVPPRRLQEMLANAIESVLDMDLFRAEQEEEQCDALHLKNMRQQIIATIEAAGLG